MKTRKSGNEYTPREKASPEFRRELINIVLNQIKENNPPETRKTMKRLLKKGYPRATALKLIASVLVTEIYEILKKEEPFNEKRYSKALRALE